MNIKLHLLLLFILLIVFRVATAANDSTTNAILSSENLEEVELSMFMGDVDVMRSIGISIALSIARCEHFNNCSLISDNSELDELITELDNRIDALSQRKSESASEDFKDSKKIDNILLTYIKLKKNYQTYLNDLTLLVDTIKSSAQRAIAIDQETLYLQSLYELEEDEDEVIEDDSEDFE